MAQTSTIEWTDVTWNPVHGCSKVSTGCKHCYAEALSLRYRQTTKPWTERNAAQNVLLKPHKLREPLSNAGPWKSPCRVFVNSMSDLFHEEIPDEYIARVFAVMAAAPQHTFQVLTKRPERMREWFAWEGRGINRCGTVRNEFDFAGYADKLGDPMARLFPWPLPNVWLGVSIENRKWVGRADVLRQTPAAVRFISAEPLLGPLAERMTHGRHCPCSACAAQDWAETQLAPCGMHGSPCPPVYAPYRTLGRSPFGNGLDGIDWLIVGGESGSGHRSFNPEWARDLRDACAASGTAFFVKQLGGARPGTKLEDLPEDLRIREMPR